VTEHKLHNNTPHAPRARRRRGVPVRAPLLNLGETKLKDLACDKNKIKKLKDRAWVDKYAYSILHANEQAHVRTSGEGRTGEEAQSTLTDVLISERARLDPRGLVPLRELLPVLRVDLTAVQWVHSMYKFGWG
jgi:hypothetical protein